VARALAAVLRRKAAMPQAAADQHIRLGAPHSVAGWRGSPDIETEAESKARPAPPGPTCRCDELRAWSDADPTSTGGQLLDRLQEAYPGRYPDGLLRTVQRRLKIWRREIAHALVFGRAGQGASEPFISSRSCDIPCRVSGEVHPAGFEHGVVLAAIKV